MEKEQFIQQNIKWLEDEPDFVIDYAYEMHDQFKIPTALECFLDYITCSHELNWPSVIRCVSRDKHWSESDARRVCVQLAYSAPESITPYLDVERAYANLHNWFVGKNYLFEIKDHEDSY